MTDRKTWAALAVGGLLAGQLLLAPAARAGGDDLGDWGVVGVRDFVATDGCAYQDVLYAITGVPAGGTWDLSLSDGSGLSAYLHGTSTDITGPGQVFWCTSDGVGQFTMTGTLEVYDSDYAQVASVPVSFDVTVTKQATAVGVKATTTKPRRGHAFALRGCVNSGGARDRYREVVVQHRAVGGSWRRLDSTYTDSEGCYRYEVTAGSKTRYYRVTAGATDVEKLGRSAAVKVTPRR